MFQKDVDLTPFTTFGVPVKTKYFASFSSENELKGLLGAVNQDNLQNDLLILGGGSNILFIKDFPGVTLKNEIKGIEIAEENDENIVLKVGGGEVWHDFVVHTINNGWGGLENLSLIPGCVGASPIQNIGAYGVEIKDLFISLETIEIESGNKRVFNNYECQFSYRNSIFKNEAKGKYVITYVNYRLSKTPKVITHYGAIGKELEIRKIVNPTIKDVSDVVIAIRKSKLPDPKEIGSAGSFFKNPVISIEHYNNLKNKFKNIPCYKIDEQLVKIPAGWLIDNLGWKGKTFGDFGVHKMQALVLVNYKNASGEAIYQLSKQIIKDVKNEYDISLEREVNILP